MITAADITRLTRKMDHTERALINDMAANPQERPVIAAELARAKQSMGLRVWDEMRGKWV
jgi:hypothetical protein